MNNCITDHEECRVAHGNKVRHTAIDCKTLQHTAPYQSINDSITDHGECCVARGTLQHIERHCNALQRTATTCNTLQQPATHCYTSMHQRVYYRSWGLLCCKWHAATHCNTLQQRTTTCKTLQNITASMSVIPIMRSVVSHMVRCNTLQRTATLCNALQHIETHCNTLQHTATHCNTTTHQRVYYQSWGVLCRTWHTSSNHQGSQRVAPSRQMQLPAPIFARGPFALRLGRIFGSFFVAAPKFTHQNSPQISCAVVSCSKLGSKLPFEKRTVRSRILYIYVYMYVSKPHLNLFANALECVHQCTHTHTNMV